MFLKLTSPVVGEFDVDPSTIEETQLAPKDVRLVFEIRKSERKTAPSTGNAFIQVDLTVPDIANSLIVNNFFMTSKALSSRSSAVSYKKFLEKVGLPLTTTSTELTGFRFIGTLKHEGKGEDAQARLQEAVGPVQG